MKKKLKLSHDTPSSIIYSHLFYNLTDLYQWLLTAHSKALLYMMNDTGLIGDTIRIRIQQLQHKEWLHKSPLIEWPFDNATKFKDCGNTLISSFIPTKYQSIANDLRRYSLIFMEQLVNSDGNQMLTFFDHCIRPDIPHSPKSPK
ncbi:1541_t:CDS:2, partial [Funneliformis geosporum]